MDFTNFSASDLELMDNAIGYKGDKSAHLPLKTGYLIGALKRKVNGGEHESNEKFIRFDNLLKMLEQIGFVDVEWEKGSFASKRYIILKAPAIAAFKAGGFKAVRRNQRWEKRKKKWAFWFSVVALVVSLLTFAGKLPSIIDDWQHIKVVNATNEVQYELPVAPLPNEPAIVDERGSDQRKNGTRMSGDSTAAPQ